MRYEFVVQNIYKTTLNVLLQMKTLFMIVSSGTSARNMLRTDVLGDLKKSDIRIVLLVPEKLKEAFTKEFAEENLIVESYPPNKKSENVMRFLRYIDTLLPGIAYPNISTTTYRLKHEQMKILNPYRYRLYRVMYHIERSKTWRSLMRWIDWTFIPKTWCKKLFAKYNPDAVFSTNVMHADEYYFAEYAQKKAIPVVGNILSWDNLTSKGSIPYAPAKMVVWNDTMKKDLLVLHNFPGDKVCVAGAPQFDMYFNDSLTLPSREEYLKGIGADPSMKMVTYACGAAGETTKFQTNVVADLARMAEDQSLVEPFQLIIRPHPRTDPGTFVPFIGKKNVFVAEAAKKPQTALGIFPDAWNPDTSDMINMHAFLKYSDVLVNFSSTMTIDGCAVGTPVVNVCFGDDPSLPYIKSARRVYDYDHFKNLMDSGAFPVAYNKDEMAEYINNYLKNPELDKENRAALAKYQCTSIDGTAGKRIAECVKEVLEI